MSEDVDPIQAAINARFRDRRALNAKLEGRAVPTKPQSALDRFISVLNPPKPEPDPIPLNGPEVLRAALGAHDGTINGASTDSAAALIRDALAGRIDQAG